MPSSGPDQPRPRHQRAEPNEDRLIALGDAIERRGGGRLRGGRRRRRHRWVLWSALTVGLVVVLIAGTGVFLWFYFGGKVKRTGVAYEQAERNGAVNILLVGSTDRCHLKQQNNQYGLCQNGVTGVNSDIVMVAHLANGKASLLSIPRDLFEPNARQSAQANKIDAALYQGPSQLAAAVEEDFGIPINHFIELNFDSFANVVNAVGGINMYFPMRLFDAYSSLNIERAGCYHLDGLHALQVVRARHLQIGFPGQGTDPRLWPNESLSDLARIRRTHEFLRVVAAKIASMGIGNPINDLHLANTLLPDLTVDNGFSEGEMLSLASGYHSTNIAQVPQLTYPVILNYGSASAFGNYVYKGGLYGDVEFPIQPGGWQTVDSIFGVKPGFSSWNGKPLPLAGAFHLSVEDGSGVPNQQATIATELTHKGFHVTQTGVRTPVGSTSETVVWYGGPPPPKSGNWNSASLAAAQRVMTTLQGPVTLGYDPAEVTPGDMVTVQTGTDLTVATRDWTAPPTTTTTTTHPATSSSTSSTVKGTTTTTHPVTATTVYDPPGVASDNQFSHPSATAQPLQAWDPRACPANTRIILVDRSGGG